MNITISMTIITETKDTVAEHRTLMRYPQGILYWMEIQGMEQPYQRSYF